MGVKGLQYFMERCCPNTCVTVDLREMARQHVTKTQQDSTTTANTSSPTLVVDGMACLCYWYSCEDWVCGGQWREYMDVLKSWVEAFTSAGIRLVFFFDGVVEEQKRKEWVKRRCRRNREIAKVLRYLKARGEQPGREMFCLPPGMASFTRFALRSLGQEVFCSMQEADFEIARYARQHNCLGILGQDSDFIIYNSAPYLSVAKLQINRLTTVMYDRRRLCQTVGLTVHQLPLLACLLGNDVVSVEKMVNIRNEAMAVYRQNNPPSPCGAPQGQMVLAVSHLVSSLRGREEEESELLSLNLSAPLRELLQKGVSSYILPDQEAVQRRDSSTASSASAFEKLVSAEVLKACREKHVAAEGYMVYNIVCEGVIECSNTLEDEEDTELLPQAVVFKPCRQRIYGLVLLHGHDGSDVHLPAIKEWFVYPGNPLQEPEIVHPVPISLPGDQITLDLLWFGTGPEVSALRLTSFFSIFDCQELSDLYEKIEDSLLAALCLITYIVLQVNSLSQEDVDAYLSQAVCVRLKSTQELQRIKLPVLSSRAVQLGSLYIRGLGNLLGANCASGCPLPSAALMPWHSFDGRLFHSKYLLAHSGAESSVLLESNSSCLNLFLCLREKLTETCRKHGRVLQSRPKPAEQSPRTTPGFRYGERNSGGPSSSGGSWRERGENPRGLHHGGGWREREETRGGRSNHGNRVWQRGGHGEGMRGGQHLHSHQFYPNFQDGRSHNTSRQPKQSRGGSDSSRGRYQPAPRWSQPPGPGT